METAWTLTNILHGVMVYLFMHTVKGTPFHTSDQGSSRFLTAWEQIDGEIQVHWKLPVICRYEISNSTCIFSIRKRENSSVQYQLLYTFYVSFKIRIKKSGPNDKKCFQLRFIRVMNINIFYGILRHCSCALFQNCLNFMASEYLELINTEQKNCCIIYAQYALLLRLYSTATQTW